jgi:FixJ family two-component response regulator
MSLADTLVLVLDDDAAFRRAVERLLVSVGLSVVTFASVPAFFQAAPPAGPACLVLDVRMPGVSGLELQERLAAMEPPLPIIFLTGYGTVPMSVQAMKAGAVDFLLKPCDDQVLLDAVSRALTQAEKAWRVHREQRTVHDRLGTLTPRERSVLAMVTTGMLNKQVAEALGMSEKTVKVHRARIMQKMHATSLADLVRMADRAGLTA